LPLAARRDDDDRSDVRSPITSIFSLSSRSSLSRSELRRGGVRDALGSRRLPSPTSGPRSSGRLLTNALSGCGPRRANGDPYTLDLSLGRVSSTATFPRGGVVTPGRSPRPASADARGRVAPRWLVVGLAWSSSSTSSGGQQARRRSAETWPVRRRISYAIVMTST